MSKNPQGIKDLLTYFLELIDGIDDLNPDELAELINKFSNKDIQSITKLSLISRGLNELPYNIGKLVNLEDLDISYNDISTLPDSFVNLVNLEKFWAVECLFCKMPKLLIEMEVDVEISCNQRIIQ